MFTHLLRTKIVVALFVWTGLFALPALAEAASGDVVIGTVTIEQTSPMEKLGRWTLLKPDGTSVKFSTASYTVDIMQEGNYTLFAQPPEGMSTTIVLSEGDTQIRTVERPQMSFTFKSGNALHFSITYVLSRVGEVGVNSNPSGIPFRLEGPNNMRIDKKTPFAMKDTPEGQYSVQYYPKGCITPRPQSLMLRKDGRVNFSISIDCATLEIGPDEWTQKDEFPNTPQGQEPITVLIEGKDVTLRDVPQNAWFASYVFTVVKSGIVSGYRGSDGRPLGLFGPGNAITLAELAKIAHEVAGIDESDIKELPKNRTAKDTWFSPYIASAEALHWEVFSVGSVDLLRPATRGEVLTTLLQAMDILLLWPKGDVFKDVSRATPYAGAIETAAAEEIVSGGEDGRFRPVDQVNRAEVAKILSILIEKYRDSKAVNRTSVDN